jgi:ribulose-5-phosphate 4-epimerase/fuculose-1-phosphate aldolase
MKEEVKYRQDIVHFGKLLHERGYVAATDGNLSVRLDCQSILITPTQECRRRIVQQRQGLDSARSCRSEAG